MYYDEQVIDGVLHYRTTPNGEWKPFSLPGLTAKYLDAKARATARSEP